VDALLSNGREELGENRRVYRMLQEVFRVMKPSGRFLLISGNDSFILSPYLYSVNDWKVESRPMSGNHDQRRTKRCSRSRNRNTKANPLGFAKLSTTLYSMIRSA